ncbi:hypothetical protein [Nonomuraea lactucae]|uniref:hypothetical protein n=1 Tax=Nonomuraea lactucae TaxID=2249762 RepID=UPI0013B45869|nr:hypothetical protein [Nonomuraea lactucae]
MTSNAVTTMLPRRSLADAATVIVGLIASVAILLTTTAPLTGVTVLLVLVWLGIPIHAGTRLLAAVLYARAERSAYRLGADHARYRMHVAFNMEERQDVGRRS